MVTVAGCPVEWSCMADQVSASGVQVQDSACFVVSLGGSLVSETQSGSMGPIFIRSPFDLASMAGALLAKVTLIFHDVAAGSRHKNVGGVIPGGKMEPSSG